jgi:hypothetical protein
VRGAEVQVLFTASAKKVVVLVITGLVMLLPVPIRLPPVAAVYQFTVPADGVAVNAAEPWPHIAAAAPAVTVGRGVTITFTTAREADVQPL